MSKTLTSFRLPEKTHENLKLLGENHKASQAEIIEAMVRYFASAENDRSAELGMLLEASRLEKNPEYAKILKNLEERKEKGLL